VEVWTGWEHVAGSCEHDNETYDSINAGNLI
jgi:hypothetical protein